jgi:hypothetical protein
MGIGGGLIDLKEARLAFNSRRKQICESRKICAFIEQDKKGR